jgi:hypothetical protein
MTIDESLRVLEELGRVDAELRDLLRIAALAGDRLHPSRHAWIVTLQARRAALKKRLFCPDETNDANPN